MKNLNKSIKEKTIYDGLANAFGKNGIQAMIIEAAVPGPLFVPVVEAGPEAAPDAFTREGVPAGPDLDGRHGPGAPYSTSSSLR